MPQPAPSRPSARSSPLPPKLHSPRRRASSPKGARAARQCCHASSDGPRAGARGKASAGCPRWRSTALTPAPFNTARTRLWPPQPGRSKMSTSHDFSSRVAPSNRGVRCFLAASAALAGASASGCVQPAQSANLIGVVVLGRAIELTTGAGPPTHLDGLRAAGIQPPLACSRSGPLAAPAPHRRLGSFSSPSADR